MSSRLLSSIARRDAFLAAILGLENLGRTAFAFAVLIFVFFFGYWGAHVLLGAFDLFGEGTSTAFLLLLVVSAVLGCSVATIALRRLSGWGRLRFAASGMLGLAVLGAAFRGFPFHPVGIFNALHLGFFLIYSCVWAVGLLILLWSLRAVAGLLLDLLGGPDRSTAMRKLGIGLTGAAFGSVGAAAIAFASERQVALIVDNWFYVLVVPALATFGLWCPPARRSSAGFAASLMLCAACIAVTVEPQFMLRRHWVPCTEFLRGGGHTVFGFEGAPWQWLPPDHLSDWLVAPIAMVELTVWHVVDPVTEQDCSAG